MKKFTALLLTILFLLSMTSCALGEKLSAYDQYMKAAKALNEAGSMETDITSVIKMTMGDESQTMGMDGSLKLIVNSETDIDFEMTMDMDLFGQTIPVLYYYTDGFMYMDMMGIQMKLPLPMEKALEQAGGTETLDFDESAVKDVTTETVDGETIIKFKLDASAITAVLEDQIADLAGSLEDADIDYNFGDVDLKIVIGSDKNLKSHSLAYSFTMEMDGEEVACEMDMTMDIVKIGNVTIDFPSFDGYMEISEEDMESIGL